MALTDEQRRGRMIGDVIHAHHQHMKRYVREMLAWNAQLAKEVRIALTNHDWDKARELTVEMSGVAGNAESCIAAYQADPFEFKPKDWKWKLDA